MSKERSLYIIPIQHTNCELGLASNIDEENENAAQKSWQIIKQFFDKESELIPKMTIYQDSLPDFGSKLGPEMIEWIMKNVINQPPLKYSPNCHQLSLLHNEGAEITGIEPIIPVSLHFIFTKIDYKLSRFIQKGFLLK